VWTSRYGNPKIAGAGFVPVGITRGAPRFALGYELRANLYDFAPTYAMMKMADGEHGRAAFTQAMRERLDALGPLRAREQLEAMQDGEAGIVLLCYEDLTQPGQWCHRQIVAAWLDEQLGLTVQELEDPGQVKKKPSPQAGLFT